MFDPDVERLLAAIAAKPGPPLEQLSLEEARKNYRDSCLAFGLPRVELPEIRDLVAPDGSDVRIYRPVAGDADLPWMLFLHGGGWVLGDLDTHDVICRTLAQQSGFCVIALDYPRAPERPFPAAFDSARGAIAWARDQAAALRIDADRMAIGGDSAGAALAASCCQQLRDAGLVLPRMQMLFYPATDLTASTASYTRITEGVPLTAQRMRWFLGQYLPDPAQAEDWRASPARAATLAGLPPAFIVTAGHDPLRDEGIDYAQRLEQEGVRTVHLHLGDQIHGFLTLGRVLRQAAPVLVQAAQEMRRLAG